MIIAWHGEPKLKEAVVRQLRDDQRLGRIAQGVYWDDDRGCNLGCLTRCSDNMHEAAERMFGIEHRVGYWLEVVFEGLPAADAPQWVIDNAEAIPVGADLSKCHHHLAYWLLGPESPSAAGNAHKAVAKDVAAARELHRRAASGEVVLRVEWDSAAYSAARSAAYSAAGSAARSAADSAADSARSAADSAADSAGSAAYSAGSAAYSAARSAARSAADSAADSARSAADSARSAAYSAAWKSIAAKSLDIFRNAPVIGDCDACEEVVRETIAWLDNPVYRTLIKTAESEGAR